MQSTPSTSRVSARAIVAALGVALAMSMPVVAKQADRNEEIHVDSKSFDGRQQPQGIVIYTGSVVITQGSLKITGAKATMYLNDDNSIKRAVIDGGPATIQQQDEQNLWMRGRANNIDYNVDNDVAVLTGAAHVEKEVDPADRKKLNQSNGDKLTYNTKDSTMTGESNGSAPVHMIFQPKQQQPGTAPAAQPKKP